MKKQVSILLSVVLAVCTLFCGCANSNSQGAGNDSISIKNIDEKDFHKYLNTIDLTKENWKDYFDLVREEKTQTHTDSFGEIISSKSFVYYHLQLKDMGQFTGGFSGVTIEVKDLKTGTIKTFSSISDNDVLKMHFDNEYGTDTAYTIDDFECTRIKGKIVLIVDVPEKVIGTDEKGREYFFVRREYDGEDGYVRFNKGELNSYTLEDFLD